MTEGPLSIESIERLYWLAFFSETSPFQIIDKYECSFIKKGADPPYLLENKSTKKKIYLGASATIQSIWNEEDISGSLDIIFNGIDMEEDCFSVVFPLAKITRNTILRFGKSTLEHLGSLLHIPISSVAGHTTLVIIEKKHDKTSIFLLDPKAYSFDDSFISSFLELIKRKIVSKEGSSVEITRIFCGFQSITDNTYCVYFVFKMIYAYLCGEFFCSNSIFFNVWLEFCFLVRSFKDKFIGSSPQCNGLHHRAGCASLYRTCPVETNSLSVDMHNVSLSNLIEDPTNNQLIGTNKSCLHKKDVSFIWNILNPSVEEDSDDKLSILSFSD